jgi:UDPglucose 6-dehydrogenase
MKLAIIGTGYVGLVSGPCFAEFGAQVVCVDNDVDRIARLNKGEIPIYEPGLEDLVGRNRNAERLTFETELEVALDGADAVFIAVGTPSRRGDGHADLSYVFAAARSIARALEHGTVVVTKSTVPVGTGQRLKSLFQDLRPDLDIAVASNPEFLREGSAIEDFLRPDRVICGVDSEQARAVLAEIYRPLNLIETPVLFMDLPTAELTKYAANSFLAMKITFINEIADLCEAVGGNVQDVARGIGMDGRIGRKFLHAGPGYGGSCFPKDTLALLRTAEQASVPQRIIETVVNVNDSRKRSMARRIVRACGGHVDGRRMAILGVTFKPNTDDIREAPSLVIIPMLQAEGAHICAVDPEGSAQAALLLPDVEWSADAYEAATGADAVVLLTEWNQFRNLDLKRLRQVMAGNLFVDLRNVYKSADLAEAGFAYHSIGRLPAGAADMAFSEHEDTQGAASTASTS